MNYGKYLGYTIMALCFTAALCYLMAGDKSRAVYYALSGGIYWNISYGT